MELKKLLGKKVETVAFTEDETRKKVAACEAEVKAVLDRHGCELVYDELYRNGQVVRRQISVVLRAVKKG